MGKRKNIKQVEIDFSIPKKLEVQNRVPTSGKNLKGIEKDRIRKIYTFRKEIKRFLFVLEKESKFGLGCHLEANEEFHDLEKEAEKLGEPISQYVRESVESLIRIGLLNEAFNSADEEGSTINNANLGQLLDMLGMSLSDFMFKYTLNDR